MAIDLYNSGSPFFNKGSLYGGKQNNSHTPYVVQDLDPANPQGVYTSFLAQHGLGGTGRESAFAKNQYSQTLAGYQAALRTNPGLSYRDYINSQFGNQGQGLHQMFLNATPNQRGEQPNLWAGNSRTISWG